MDMMPFYCRKKEDGFYVIDVLGDVPSRGPYKKLSSARKKQFVQNRLHMNKYYPGDIIVHDRFVEYNGIFYPKTIGTQNSASGGRYYWHKKIGWTWIEGFMWRCESKTWRNGELYEEVSQLVTGSHLSDYGFSLQK